MTNSVATSATSELMRMTVRLAKSELSNYKKASDPSYMSRVIDSKSLAFVTKNKK